MHSKILYPTQRVHHLATCTLYVASLGFLFQWPVREHKNKNVDKLTCYCSKFLACGQAIELKANDIAKLWVLVLNNGLMQKARSGWSKFMLPCSDIAGPQWGTAFVLWRISPPYRVQLWCTSDYLKPTWQGFQGSWAFVQFQLKPQRTLQNWEYFIQKL